LWSQSGWKPDIAYCFCILFLAFTEGGALRRLFSYGPFSMVGPIFASKVLDSIFHFPE
jgi:hypothetical protein